MFLYGASGHSKVVIEVVRSGKEQFVEALYDDNPGCDELLGVKVVSDKTVFESKSEWLIAIGNNRIRKKINDKLKLNYVYLVHSNATLSPSSKLGKGSVVMAGAVINANALVGKHCIVNTGAVIEHDCIVGDYVHVSPGAALAGNVEVGEGTHIGIGAVAIQGVKIGRWATIGAGAVIIRDVPDFAVVVGNPGKIIKYNRF